MSHQKVPLCTLRSAHLAALLRHYQTRHHPILHRLEIRGESVDLGAALRLDYADRAIPLEVGEDILHVRPAEAGVLGELGTRLVTLPQSEPYAFCGTQGLLRGIIGGSEFRGLHIYPSFRERNLHVERFEPGGEVGLLVPDADPQGTSIAVVLHGLNLQDASCSVLLEGAAKGGLALVALTSLQLPLMIYDHRRNPDGAQRVDVLGEEGVDIPRALHIPAHGKAYGVDYGKHYADHLADFHCPLEYLSGIHAKPREVVEVVRDRYPQSRT